MWQHPRSAFQCRKQTRLSMVHPVRLDLRNLVSVQVDFRSHGTHLLRLVDGHHQESPGKRLHLEKQAHVLRAKKRPIIATIVPITSKDKSCTESRNLQQVTAFFAFTRTIETSDQGIIAILYSMAQCVPILPTSLFCCMIPPR